MYKHTAMMKKYLLKIKKNIYLLNKDFLKLFEAELRSNLLNHLLVGLISMEVLGALFALALPLEADRFEVFLSRLLVVFS